MPRQKEPLRLLEAKGKSHLSAREKAERAKSEVKAPIPKRVRAPKWLPEELREEFNDLSHQLLDLGIFSKLDRDTLARYLIAHQLYLRGLNFAQGALSDGNSGEAVKWTTVVGRYFAQCRECANDLGLTITSRCKLTVPEGTGGKREDNPFEQMMKARRERSV